VDNFPSVVELDVFDCPELKRISGLSMLQKIRIVRCTKLEVLGVPALDSLVLQDTTISARCMPKVSRVELQHEAIRSLLISR
jgi:hypothetical protein